MRSSSSCPFRNPTMTLPYGDVWGRVVAAVVAQRALLVLEPYQRERQQYQGDECRPWWVRVLPPWERPLPLKLLVIYVGGHGFLRDSHAMSNRPWSDVSAQSLHSCAVRNVWGAASARTYSRQKTSSVSARGTHTD